MKTHSSALFVKENLKINMLKIKNIKKVVAIVIIQMNIEVWVNIQVNIEHV